VSANHDLAAGLAAALGGACSVSTYAVMGDLLWGVTTPADREAPEVSVIVERVGSRRRIVLMTVRDEIRYWATTDKDPFVSSRSSMGVVASFPGAVLLCHEFVARELEIEKLTAPISRMFYDTDR
jgi:hypothetical protein